MSSESSLRHRQEALMFRTLPLLCLLLIVLVQPAPAPLAGQPAALDDPGSLFTRLNTATSNLEIGERRVLGNLLFFNGDDDRSGAELWVSDGTAAGTLKLADLPASLELATPLGAGVLFTSGAWGGTLWFSDGTGAGTRQLLTLAHDQRFVSLGRVHNRALLTVDGSFAGELWASDGTREGTRRVQTFARKTYEPAQRKRRSA
jgi:ELWxxDGT repeat protein